MIEHPNIKLNFRLAPPTEAPVFLHPKITPLKQRLVGPFIHNANGDLLAVHDNHIHHSLDQGQTWQAYPIFNSDEFYIGDSRSLICLASGTLILSFANVGNMHFNWRRKTNSPTKTCSLSHYIVRSFDGGLTWQTPQKIQSDYAAATSTLIQLKTGEVVVSAQNMDYENARHYALSLTSGDDGETWQSSNRLDMGGRGHHGGCYEGTLIELSDGRLWYCIRTNRDWFWDAYSYDKGKSWIETKVGLPASSSPAMLTRLHSGRIALVYNQLYPQGQTEYARRAGQFSEVAASWMREELSICLSEDEGRSWTKPIVIAQCKGAWLAYPMIYEVEPGKLWVTTLQSELKVVLKESDFVQKNKLT
ncbi:MAG: sialidase family protein [Pseudomonadota bacterium]|nr:sialidase family protein [Pseudomonadota bacterium]